MMTPLMQDPSLEVHEEIHSALKRFWTQDNFVTGAHGDVFQNEYAQFCSKHFSFSSKLSHALKETLVALSIPEESEVICPAWISAEHVQSILSLGLKPVFAEINPYTLSLDYSDVSHKLSKYTRAIVLNYPFGFPADPCSYVALCKQHNMQLIEIVPSPIGSQVDEKFIGTFGDVGIFESHPNQKYNQQKNCLVVTDHKKVYDHFAKKGLQHFSQLEGILGMWFLENFPTQALKRKEIAQRYHQSFTKILHLSVLYELANANWVHEVYPIRVSQKIRESLTDELTAHGIAFNIPASPAHMYPYIQNVLRAPQLMMTEKLIKETIFLPIVPDMEPLEQNRIIETVLRFFQKDKLYAA